MISRTIQLCPSRSIVRATARHRCRVPVISSQLLKLEEATNVSASRSKFSMMMPTRFVTRSIVDISNPGIAEHRKTAGKKFSRSLLEMKPILNSPAL